MNAELIIDNINVAATNGATFERLNPAGDKVVTTAAAASIADAVRAAESAGRAFETWSKIGPVERRRLLMAAADNIEAKLDEISAAMASEIGASAMWSGLNVGLAAQLFREAASLTTQITGETIPTDRPGVLSLTVRQPVGAVVSIAPWNGPILLGARSIAYPIACGNTVVFRGSDLSPRTHALLAEAVNEAGFPAGVLNFIVSKPGDGADTVDALIKHPAIRRINFTGSTQVGRIIAEKAGRELKRCLLELGGKAPLVVLDDADLDAAVEAAVFGSFIYQGQICMTTERIVVDEQVADIFVAKFARRAETLKIGDPALDPSIVLGPVINGHSAERINGLVRDAVDKGAVLATGGYANGVRMAPTIVDHCTPEMQIYDEETFGPVTIVVRVKGVEDAVRVANDTRYGLAASVFGRDTYRALQVAQRIDAGAVHVNGATVQNEPQAPYGGMKASGYGRFDGKAVIDEFTELKWVTIEPANQPYPI